MRSVYVFIIEFFCSHAPHVDVAYTLQTLGDSVDTPSWQQLVQQGVLVYGMKTVKTDPFIVLDLIDNAETLYQQAQKLMPLLFAQDKTLHRYFDKATFFL